MKTSDAIREAELKIIAGDIKETYDGVYVGDLLSRCMSHVTEGCLWITIMNNVNVIAVASLTDCAAVILAEGVVMPDDVVNTANEKGVTVLSSDKTAYELCEILSELKRHE